MKFSQPIITLSILLIISCNPPKQTNEATSKPAEEPVAVQSNPQPVLEPMNNDAQAVIQKDQPTQGTQSTQNMQSTKETKYRLIVSLISIGEGTDRNGKEIFDSFLNEWKTKQKKEITYEAVPWGREGEVDFCFPLSEINEAHQKQFVSEIKAKFKGHNLVQFTENEPCIHKR